MPTNAEHEGYCKTHREYMQRHDPAVVWPKKFPETNKVLNLKRSDR